MLPSDNHEHVDDAPRSMRYEDVRERRKAMLREPHMEVLTTYVERLQDRQIGFVPWFDPLDGGVNAKALFLMEKPGPMTAEPNGSSFISRNNDDPTAEAMFLFMRQAGIDKRLTVTWNVIPAWNGTIAINGKELNRGVDCVGDLMTLLPEIRVIVFVGRKAATAMPLVKPLGIAMIESYHPSPIVRASRRDEWDAIPNQWKKILPYLG